MVDSDKKHSRQIERAYNTQDKVSHYAEWAPSYEADLQRSGYQAPAHAVALMKKLVPVTAQIIEFGCGSGLVGRQLADTGYQRIVGVDVSPEMLKLATNGQPYQSLREHDLTKPLLDDIRYEAGICVGVCAFGPLMADHIVHMTSVLIENAPLLLTVNGRAWSELDWPEKLDDAQQRYGFTIEYINTIPYLTEENIDGKLLVIRNHAIESELYVQK